MAVKRRVTTQDISWFLDLHRNGQIDLNPPYQRRSVWTPKDRRFFLDTIFRDYPSPSVFLYKEMRQGKTVYAVVDGKQRLQTIINFSENKIAMDKHYGDSRLDGKKWKHIEQDPTLTREFWDYVIPVEFIAVVEGATFVNQVFERLNRNVRKLVEQELRHAKYDGWFISFVERESEESEDWKELRVVTTARAKRMRDVQFLSELLIVVLKGDVGGFDQNEIERFYAKYDDLDDPDIELDEDAVKEKFVAARKFLIEMERHKQRSTVTTHARDFKDLYSLWACVALNRDELSTPGKFAQKYCAFMEKVNKFKDKKYWDEVQQLGKQPKPSDSLKYYQNSIGANTEPPQRKARHEALRGAMFGEHKSL